MAVTIFENAFELVAAGDTALPRTGYAGIEISAIHIIKTTAGDVTLKDGAGNAILYTLADNENFIMHFPGGWIVSGLEFDAISGGSAVVIVFATDAATLGG